MLFKPPSKPRLTAFQRFTHETTLDGFKQIAEAQTGIAKWYWSLLLLLALGGTTINVVRTARSFFTREITSTIKTFMPDTFPDILICPEHWRNEEKMAELNLTQLDDIALHSVFPLPTYRFARETEVEISGYLIDFMMKLKDQNLDDLFLQISQPANVVEVLEHPLRSKRFSIQVRKKLSTKGVCYEVKTNGKITVQSADTFDLSLQLDPLPEPFPTQTAPPRVNLNHVYIGSDANVGIMFGETILTSGYDHLVKIRLTKLRRVSRPHHECQENANTDKDFRLCLVDRIRQFCAENFRLPIYTPGNNYFITNVSFWLDYENSCLLNRNAVRKELGRPDALRHCVRPCTEDLYDISVETLQDVEAGNASYITFKFENPRTAFVIEETMAYNTATFLGDIGGQISLWTGASLLSLAHVAWFWLAAWWGLEPPEETMVKGGISVRVK